MVIVSLIRFLIFPRTCCYCRKGIVWCSYFNYQRAIFNFCPLSSPSFFDSYICSRWNNYPDLPIHAEKREDLVSFSGIKPDLVLVVPQPIYKRISFLCFSATGSPENKQVLSVLRKELIIESKTNSGLQEISVVPDHILQKDGVHILVKISSPHLPSFVCRLLLIWR